MTCFRERDRVFVGRDSRGRALDTPGTVMHVRRDRGAWIALDRRLADAGDVHPWPASDERATWVLAYPSECSPAPNAQQRRAS